MKKGMGRMVHQREADPILRKAGYSFSHMDSHNHNVYYNDHRQRIVVFGSPRVPSRALKAIHTQIARHEKERTPVTTATVDRPRTTHLIAMAPSILTEPGSAQKRNRIHLAARYNAATQWVRRVVERHGPLPAGELRAACAELGIDDYSWRRISSDLGLQLYRGEGKKASWFWCLPHQMPEGKAASRSMGNKEEGVEIGVKVEVDDVPSAPDADTQQLGHGLDEVPVPTELAMNGKAPGGDVEAAVALLMESLGKTGPSQDKLRGFMEKLAEAEGILADLRHEIAELVAA